MTEKYQLLSYLEFDEHFIKKVNAVNFRGLLNEYTRLKDNFRRLLKTNYKQIFLKFRCQTPVC